MYFTLGFQNSQIGRAMRDIADDTKVYRQYNAYKLDRYYYAAAVKYNKDNDKVFVYFQPYPDGHFVRLEFFQFGRVVNGDRKENGPWIIRFALLASFGNEVGILEVFNRKLERYIK